MFVKNIDFTTTKWKICDMVFGSVKHLFNVCLAFNKTRNSFSGVADL